MPKLTGTTYVVDPDGQPVLLREGDELPTWAKRVGDHLLDEPRQKRRAARKRSPKPKPDQGESDSESDEPDTGAADADE